MTYSQLCMVYVWCMPHLPLTRPAAVSAGPVKSEQGDSLSDGARAKRAQNSENLDISLELDFQVIFYAQHMLSYCTVAHSITADIRGNNLKIKV